MTWLADRWAWFCTDFHWLAVLGLWFLAALFAYSLCAIAATPAPIDDEVFRRREHHRRVRIQEAQARARFEKSDR